MTGSFFQSKRAAIITGAEDVSKRRGQIAILRPPNERKPMNPLNRQTFESHNFFIRIWFNLLRFGSSALSRRKSKRRHSRSDQHSLDHSCLDENFPWENDNVEEKLENDIPQYTLKSTKTVLKKTTNNSCFRIPCTCCFPTTSISHDEYDLQDAIEGCLCLFIDVNAIISAYISWSFRTSYFLLMLSFSIFYFALIVIFAAVYLAFASYHPECIISAGKIIGTGEDAVMFADLFHLSWTTFSTVGFGVVYPSTGASTFLVPEICIGVGIIGSFEAFLGVLYAGGCCAILFNKVIRSQSQAQVLFSDPIVIRFGREELSEENATTSSLHSDIEAMIAQENLGNKKNIPCPLLEFRLVNRLHNISAGEIVEAQLNCLAILESKSCHSDTIVTQPGCEQLIHNCNVVDNTSIRTTAIMAKHLNEREKSGNKTSEIDGGDPGGDAFHSTDTKEARIFCKLALDASDHPFFRRVWYGRHRLDENSPLLTQSAKNLVKLNGGFWPSELNNYKSIKKSLHFRHILVCLSGTSNANATSVYAQKLYDFVDVNVGYRFVPMNYLAVSGSLETDVYLLNTVIEQRGGGAEPLQ